MEARKLRIPNVNVLKLIPHSDKCAIYYNDGGGGGTIMSFFMTLRCYRKTIQKPNENRSLTYPTTHKCKSFGMCDGTILRTSMNTKITIARERERESIHTRKTGTYRQAHTRQKQQSSRAAHLFSKRN